MNDRYLYRAKRTDNGEWVEGNLIHVKKDYYICEKPYECMDEYSSLNGQSYGFGGFKLVDQSTICQCTGLMDKNGKLIFENDIVFVKHTDGQEEYQENAKVSYTKRGFSPFSWEYYCDGCDVRCEILEVEVIGNIFDNPELLE